MPFADPYPKLDETGRFHRGWVEDREGPREVLLRLDFIGQAAAVAVAVEDLELV